MSIAYEINRLNRNKQQVKEQVNVDKDIIYEGREFIRGETVRHYPSGIKSMQMSYKDFIPVHTSTESLIETERGGTIIGKTLKGNTSQSGTPTPSSPVPVNNVTGEQIVRVCGKNLYDKNNVTRTGASNQNIKFTTTLLPNTQYVFNITSNRTWGTIYLYNSNNTQTRTIGNYSDANNLTFTTSASEVKGDFIFKAETNVDISTYDFTGVQLEKGTATSYEPYQGKDYEINLGKNLIEPKMATTTQNGITCTNNGDGSFTLNGTATASISFRLDQSTYNAHDNLKNYNGTYTLSCSEIENGLDLRVMQNSTWVSPLKMINSNAPVTGIIDKNNCFTYINVANGKSVNNLTIRPMLEKSSVATSYAPYFTPIELNKIGNYQDFIRKGTGKNLLNTNKMLYGTISQTDGITISDNSSVLYSPQYIEVKPNTKYTLSCKVSNITIRLFNYENDNTYINTSIASTSNMTTSFTTSSNTYFIRLQYNQSFNVDMQLEEGNFTYYEPYNYGDKWYIEKNVLKLVVPDAVTGTMQNSNKRFYVNGIELGTSNILRNTSSSQTYGLYCDILGEVTAGQTWNGTQGISYDYNSGQNRGCIDFAISGLTTIAEYQNALKGKAIYAIANTPEYTLIENEELIEQLEKMMPLLEGQNNISVSGNLPTGIDVDYIERVNKHLIGNTNESAE